MANSKAPSKSIKSEQQINKESRKRETDTFPPIVLSPTSQAAQTSNAKRESIMDEIFKFGHKPGSIPELDINSIMRSLAPYGHPKFTEKVLGDVYLHSAKNHDYAAGGDPLGNFKRVADILSLYNNFPISTPEGVIIVYMLKQLDAIMNQMSVKHDFKVESFESRVQDISVYATILRCMVNDHYPKE